MVIRCISGLGEVTGFEKGAFPHVELYRGIQYGIIPARFRQSQPLVSWPGEKWDATKYGPLAPFPRMIIGMALTQKSLTPEHQYEMDEFQCLTLNVTCPKGPAPAEGYPVAVWVHGGGNVAGSGAEPGYDMAAYVEYSVDLGKPIVMVTINYRLGILGFLASDDLKWDNHAAGEEGVGNYGLRDQLLAFEWVKKNISAFGGDPTRITAMGESAGSKLFKLQKPFHQAVLQSGVAPLTVRGMAHQNDVYTKIIKHLKIDNLSSKEERVNKLRSVSIEDLIGSYIALGSPVPSFQATVDGYYLRNLPRCSTLPKQVYDPSLKRLLIGDCAEEGLIFAHIIQSMGWTGERLQTVATDILGDADARKLLDIYEIKPSQSPEELFSSLIRLTTDIDWSQPMESVARSFSNGNVFYYHVAETNLFPGPNTGRAHHGVDLLFNFLTYEEYLSVEQQNLSRHMARHWISFICGEDPWTPYHQKPGTIMQYGDGGKVTEMHESNKLSWKGLRMVESLQDKATDLTAAIKGFEVIYDS